MTGKAGNNSKDRIAAIVLAAGESTRFGRPKQLAEINGMPMIARVVRQVLESSADRVIVVLGHDFENVSLALAGISGIEIINNTGYRSGLSSSLKAGLKSAGNCDAAMFLLGDMPCLGTNIINNVLEAYRQSAAPLAAATLEGRNAHPVIFRKDLWPELEQTSGDVGGRVVLKRHLDKAVTVELPDAACITDIDTREDYLSNDGGTACE